MGRRRRGGGAGVVAGGHHHGADRAGRARRAASDTVRRVVRQMHLYLPLAGIIDKAAETARVRRDLDKNAKQLRSVDGKLGNPKFRERAAPDVVTEAEALQRSALRRRQQLEQILTELTS